MSLREVIVVHTLIREGRRRSLIRRGNTLPLLLLLHAALPLLPLQKEKENSISQRRRNTKSLKSKRDKSKKKHKRKRSPTPPPSSSSVSSDSSSSLQRSPAKKKSRISRSSSPADDNPHSVARAASPVSHRDGISLYADNSDEFNNSQSEDVQDLAPDNEVQHVSEAQSDVSPQYMGFMNLVEEVFKLLPADTFPKKTEFKSCWVETGQDLQLNWRSGSLPERAFPCPNQGGP